MLDCKVAYPEMLAHCAEYLESAGDHPLNLLTTQLALNAYALAHEDRYRRWLVEYRAKAGLVDEGDAAKLSTERCLTAVGHVRNVLLCPEERIREGHRRRYGPD